jgi:hypothetical protein
MPAGHGRSGHSGELTADSTIAKILNKSRGNGHWTSAYMPLQENLGGEVGNWVLSGGGAFTVARVPMGTRHL